MKNTLYKFISAILSTTLLCSFCITTNAETISNDATEQSSITDTFDLCDDPTIIKKSANFKLIEAWTEEKGYSWKIDENGTLYIWGNAVINESGYSLEDDIPWYSERESVKNVVINEGITGIGDYAFMEHSNLVSITVPDSVEYIGEFAFFCSEKIENITVSDNNKVYSSVDGVLLNKEQTKIIKYPNGKIGAYVVPDTVTNIGMFAFRECRKLTAITISDNVESIGYGAFLDSTSLLSITIPESVTNIENFALGYRFYKGGNIAIDGFKIAGYTGSAAEKYATANKIDFVALDRVKIGDANNDGTISIFDATIIQKYLASLDNLNDDQMLAADVNVDGIVSVIDATQIQKYLAGLIAEI